MPRTTGIIIPLTPDQQKLILDATGEKVTETIFVGETDKASLEGEVSGELDKALVALLGKKNPSFDRMVAHSHAQKAQPTTWKTADAKNPSLIAIR
jgi:hypothetical protein